ncbi:uncharacterized protein STEHIDRAFT_164422 [Stereum hirsutum FP-91666 SS1]|uniref:uncharacterized protein n=1 Tax=Stereum hirsutum (strain FP-91666) TaxID=721885 RepID=UPI0004410649|nr:uncharacterized protein STEHIDRAFT_164422 [Stereum hirsutum FP-91666 SS1]EIM92068.1 hypothetical protein STEHIDRAFT_164422 [Stereum hirsutum FP-91666 SS1]
MSQRPDGDNGSPHKDKEPLGNVEPTNMPTLEDIAEEGDDNLEDIAEEGDDNVEQPSYASAATAHRESRPLPIRPLPIRPINSVAASANAAIRRRAFVDWMSGVSDNWPPLMRPTGSGPTTKSARVNGPSSSDAQSQRDGEVAQPSVSVGTIFPGDSNSDAGGSLSTQGVAAGVASNQVPSGAILSQNVAILSTEDPDAPVSDAPVSDTPQGHTPAHLAPGPAHMRYLPAPRQPIPVHSAPGAARVSLSTDSGILEGCRHIVLREAAGEIVWRRYAEPLLNPTSVDVDPDDDSSSTTADQEDAASVAADAPLTDGALNDNTSAFGNLSLEDRIFATNGRDHGNVVPAADTSPATANHNSPNTPPPTPVIYRNPRDLPDATAPFAHQNVAGYQGISLNIFGTGPPGGTFSLTWGSGPAAVEPAAAEPAVTVARPAINGPASIACPTITNGAKSPSDEPRNASTL